MDLFQSTKWYTNLLNKYISSGSSRWLQQEAAQPKKSSHDSLFRVRQNSTGHLGHLTLAKVVNALPLSGHLQGWHCSATESRAIAPSSRNDGQSTWFDTPAPSIMGKDTGDRATFAFKVKVKVFR